MIAALLHRASAALRRVVWTAAVAALLALPVMVLALPALAGAAASGEGAGASTNSLGDDAATRRRP